MQIYMLDSLLLRNFITQYMHILIKKSLQIPASKGLNTKNGNIYKYFLLKKCC